METVQFYLSSAIGILLIVLAVLVLLTCVAFLLSLVFDSDSCENAGQVFLMTLGFVAFLTLILAMGMLGVTVLDSTELLFGH